MREQHVPDQHAFVSPDARAPTVLVVTDAWRPQLNGVVHTLEEAVEAVKRVHEIDRAACRRWVEERFTVERMVDGYEAVYRRILEERR